jgi:hypothetical protein
MRLVVIALALLVASPAAAFWCTRTDQGASLGWGGRQVPLRVHSGSGVDLGATDLADAVAFAAEQWSQEACSDFTFLLGPATSERRVGFDWREGSESPTNQNLVVFRRGEGEPLDEWLHARTALAITTVTFLRSTARIVDADVEVNDGGFTFTNCEPPACQPIHDLKNTLTHELGHVLGLDHPPSFQPGAEEATMFASSSVGDLQKRELADDDIEGLCTLYPAGEPLGDCGDVTQPAPPRVLVRAVGCAATEGSGAGHGLWCLCLAWLLQRRCRRTPDLPDRRK